MFARRKKFIYIDSGRRLNGTSSDFTFTIENSQHEHFDMCVVTQASVPFTYYLISTGYNTFQLKETGEDVVSCSIPVGNYNLNSFCAIVGPLLNTASPTGSTYTMSYPKSYTQTNTAYITITVSGTTDPQLIFSSGNTVNEQFGFDSGSTQTFDGTTLTSSNVCNFLVNRSLLIHSDIVDGGSTNVLQEIYSNNAQVNGNIVYQSSDALAYSKPLRASKHNVFNIYLSDVNGIKINLNGQDMNLTLLLYERVKTFEILEGLMKHLIQQKMSETGISTEILPGKEEEETTEPRTKTKLTYRPLDYKPNFPIKGELIL